jgi:acyl-CoA thioesterase II
MLAGLDLLRIGPGRFEAPHVDGHGTGTIVFGGQLLAQLVMAASAELSEMPLTSMTVVFARSARLDLPIMVDVDVLHRGRSASSATLRVHQAESTCVSAVAVAMAPQPAFGRHADSADVSEGPEAASPLPATLLDVEARICGGVDLSDPTGGHRAEVRLWMRAPNTPPRRDASQAMIAYCSEMYFVATAFRPHYGISTTDAFSSYTPAVVSHSLAFHDPSVSSREWLLYVFSSPHMADGRIFGRGDVYGVDGRLVASIAQENLLRPISR